MKMKFLAMVAALVLANASHARANVVYDVHDVYRPLFSSFTWNVDGTITTDGNFGVLTAANIVAWDLTITAPTVPAFFLPFTLTNANSTVSSFGSGLTATPVALLFNYDVQANLMFSTETPAFSQGFVHYVTGFFGVLLCPAPAQCDWQDTDSRSGIGIVGVVTPLPAALPLFVTGLGALGLLGWRRKRKNTGLTERNANHWGQS